MENNRQTTQAQREHLTFVTDEYLAEFTEHVDKARQLITKYDAVKESLSHLYPDTVTSVFINIKGIVDYRMFIGLLVLDLATSFRVYLNARFQYEGLYSARQIIVIINEGYKKIYGFMNESNRVRERNNSFWVKDIGIIINDDLPELKSEFDAITYELEEFYKASFDGIKDIRDLSIHYDRNPAKVYDMMVQLDVEDTTQKMLPFLSLLYKMFSFTQKLTHFYNLKLNSEETTIESFDEILNRYRNQKK